MTPLVRATPSCDLVMDIHQTIMNLPIACEFFWIVGHTNKKTGQQMREQSQHHLCDEQAKAHCAQFDSFMCYL